MPGRGLDAINAVAGLDHIEINFQDAFLAPKQLNEGSEVGFEAFADPGTPRPQEHILSRLLTDGTSATDPLTCLVLFISRLNGLQVKSIVFYESSVFPGKGRTFQAGGDLIQIAPLPLHLPGLILSLALDTTLDHQPGYGWINEAVNQHPGEGDGKKPQRGLYYNPLDIRLLFPGSFPSLLCTHGIKIKKAPKIERLFTVKQLNLFSYNFERNLNFNFFV